MNFNDFVGVFFGSNYINIFLVMVILILLIIIGYLIHLQKSMREEYNNLLIVNDIKPEEKTNADIPETNEKLEDIIRLELSNNLKSGINKEKEEFQVKIEKTVDPIKAYEDKEEEVAIISAKELEGIKEEKDSMSGEISNAALIEEYEQEQELKAIISYEELLKNASILELKYEPEEIKADANRPIIKKVEVEANHYKSVSYYAEEEYLKILKDFKASLLK